MNGSFLCIKHDRSGVRAMMIDQTHGKNEVAGHCHVRFTDLTGDTTDPFDAAMDQVALDLDLQSCSSAIIFVSPAAVFFRTLSLPFGGEKKIQQILPFELEPLLPKSKEPYVSDFHLIDFKADSNMILTGSIAESRIEQYFQKLGRLGIKPWIITPAGNAEALVFLRQTPKIQDMAFLHITEDETALILVHHRKPCSVRTLPASFRSANALALAIEQTVTGYCQKTGQDIIFDIIISVDPHLLEAENLCDALEKILADRIGSGSIKKNIMDFGVLAQMMSPKTRMAYLFNFCKGKYSSGSFVKTYFRHLAAVTALFLSVTGLWMVSVSLDNSKLYKEIAALDEKAGSIFMAAFPDQKQIQDPYLQMKANVREIIKKSGVDRDQAIIGSVKAVDVLSELSGRILPSMDVEITSFLLNPGRLILSGSTDNFNTVDQVKTRLERSDVFKKVSISSAAADTKGDRINFKFNIEL